MRPAALISGKASVGGPLGRSRSGNTDVVKAGGQITERSCYQTAPLSPLTVTFKASMHGCAASRCHPLMFPWCQRQEGDVVLHYSWFLIHDIEIGVKGPVTLWPFLSFSFIACWPQGRTVGSLPPWNKTLTARISSLRLMAAATVVTCQNSNLRHLRTHEWACWFETETKHPLVGCLSKNSSGSSSN